MYYDDSSITPEDVEDGSYFDAAHKWYSDLYHMPIAERSFYIIIITLALINFWYGFQSFTGIFPLSVPVPFVTYSNDAWNDLPRAERIAKDPLEDKNDGVKRFLLQSYIVNREAYDLPKYELRYRNIASQSTKIVFDKYKENMDAKNIYSPYSLYTNRFRRDVALQSYAVQKVDEGTSYDATVVFYATVVSLFDGTEIKRSKFQANVKFQYVNFEVDQSLDEYVWIAKLLHLTGDTIRISGEEKRKIVPMKFIVSGYTVKELLE